MIRGSGLVGAVAVDAHTAVGFAADGDVATWVAGPGGLQALVCMGRPIGEPVVFGGPFAMTHERALREAEERYRRGEMGTLRRSG